MDRGRDTRSDEIIRVRHRSGPCRGEGGFTEPWSNAQTEGQNTKLKMVKRQMYGRAGFDPLPARLLGIA
jgi:transposase